jgi:putative ABC transport system permease protein
VAEGARSVGVGLIAGLALTFAVMKAMEALLFGLSPADPATIVQVAATVIVIALGAAAIPAFRAVSPPRLDLRGD